MHEATIIASILGIVQRSAAEVGAKSVSAIHIAVGRLRAVETDLLVSCFGIMAEGTICERAELIVRAVPVTGLCAACNQTVLIERYRFRCDACGGSDLAIQTGRELQVERVLAC